MRTIPFPTRGTDDECDHEDDAVGFAPRCPGCLHSPEPWEAGHAGAWRCPGCGLVLLG